MTTYAHSENRLLFALENGATHATVDTDEGVHKITLNDAREYWHNLAPGEGFTILALHWEPDNDSTGWEEVKP